MKRLAVALAALSLAATSCGAGDDPTVARPHGSAAPRPVASEPAATPSTSAATPSVTPAGLVWRACGSDGFQCSTLTVPLVDADPGKGTVDLALTRTRATDQRRRIGSLVVNPGGPGASAVGYLQAAASQVPAGVRQRFDLVAFDPRGVGRTQPVRCGTTAELDRYFALDPAPDDAAELDELQEGNRTFVAGCQARSGPTLPYVSTQDAAGDLDKVRVALGDDKLTYLGYSYGTSLGAAYLDRFPTRVRAMVLDGALDPTLTWDRLLEGQSTGFDTALKAFLADCQRTRCSFREAVEGDLGAAFDRLAAQVELTPLRGDQTRDVGPSEFSLGVGAGLYSRANGWPAIADGLTAAQNGDGSVLLALNDSYLDRTAEGYQNVSEANFAVNCIDRPWPKDAASYLALADRVGKAAPRFGPAIALSGLACSRWPVAPVSTPHPVAGKGAPAVVVIGTTGDPATPYAWSVALADQLDSGVLLTYRGDGHTVYRDGAPSCVREPVDTYLLTGRVPTARTC